MRRRNGPLLLAWIVTFIIFVAALLTAPVMTLLAQVIALPPLGGHGCPHRSPWRAAT